FADAAGESRFAGASGGTIYLAKASAAPSNYTSASAAKLGSASASTGNTDRTDASAPKDAGFQVRRRFLYADQALVGVIDYTDDDHGVLYWAHSDLVGAPTVLTDAAAHIRWAASYHALGAAQQIAGDFTLDLRLPGQVFDAATGWHDN